MANRPYPDSDSLRAGVARGEPVASPCISICRIVPETRLCEGCNRSIEEIAGWGSMGAQQRLQVWDRIFERRAVSSPNRG